MIEIMERLVAKCHFRISLGGDDMRGTAVWVYGSLICFYCSACVYRNKTGSQIIVTGSHLHRAQVLLCCLCQLGWAVDCSRDGRRVERSETF
jgi:hypothetical protein